MIVRYLLTTLVLILSIIVSTEAYSHGGPTKSCQTLYPSHGVDKQYGIASYDIKATQGPSGNFIVTINSQNHPFAGFMLQSRSTNDREKIVNGRFSEDKHSQTRNCNGDIPNTLTHRSSTPKYTIETTWTPPRGYIGGVVFRATIVQSKSVFWTALDSEPIQITANLQKPIIAYNKNRDSDDDNETIKQLDNIQLSSVPQTQSSFESHSRINYDNCDKKFCFGLPNNCVKFKSCSMLLSGGFVSTADGVAEFEIYADVNKYNGNAYYSMGLSTDKKMGDDSVTDCLVSDGRPSIQNSVNIGKSNEVLASNEFHGVTALNTSYTNGILYCKWRKSRRSTIRGNPFDLKDKKYYILLAFGSLNDNEEKEIHTDKLSSEEVVDIKAIGQIAAFSMMFLIKIHGSFMTISWLGCVSIGIFMARYFKNVWETHTFCGVKIWFAAHRSLMLFNLILILISSISVYIYVGTFIFGLHQLFGALSIIIAVLNPIGAAFRPNPDHEKRWIFNWIHWLVGNIGHISAIAAIFLAYNLTVIQLSPIYLWILIIYLLFHISSHLLMQLYSCNCRNNSKTSDISMRDINTNTTKDNEQEIKNTKGNSFSRIYLLFYVIVSVILIIALIVCIAIPQSPNNSLNSNSITKI